MAEEDRISNLPNEIIHHILSFLDMKYAIQTSALSKKWKHIWTFMPHLNLNSQTFRTSPKFVKFVNDALSHRNHHTEVSAVELSFRGAATQFNAAVRSILNYAYSHNVRQLTLVWFRFNYEVLQFPQRLFRSHTLKHLTLATHYLHGSGISVPQSAWNFPALETLSLSNLTLSDHRYKNLNLFSKCVNLRDLILHQCSMFNVEFFNVCAPQLCNLTITDSNYFPKVFNVVAPQLENLTTSVCDNSSSFLQLSTENLNSLEKVDLSMRPFLSGEERYAPGLQDLFQKLRGAKFLILDNGIIKVLSACLDQLSYQPCPFNNLKCLKQKDRIPIMAIKVRNYLFESSPTATFIMDLPQVPQKRSREEANNGTMAKRRLSSCPDQLLHKSSPSNNLKCLNQPDRIPTTSVEVENQLVKSYPSGTFNMDLPQVPHKRSRLDADNDTMASMLDKEKQQTKTVDEEKRMLEAKIFMQDQHIAGMKAMLEAMKVQHEKRMLQAKIHVQDCIIVQQKKVMLEATKLLHENGILEEKLQMQDKVIAEHKAMLEAINLQNEKRMFEAKIHVQDEIIALQKKAMLESTKLLHENGRLERKMQMQDEVIAEQKAMLEAMKLQNEKRMFETKIQRQDEIIAEQKAMLEGMMLQHEKIETEPGNINVLPLPFL